MDNQSQVRPTYLKYFLISIYHFLYKSSNNFVGNLILESAGSTSFTYNSISLIVLLIYNPFGIVVINNNYYMKI